MRPLSRTFPTRMILAISVLLAVPITIGCSKIIPHTVQPLAPEENPFEEFELLIGGVNSVYHPMLVTYSPRYVKVVYGTGQSQQLEYAQPASFEITRRAGDYHVVVVNDASGKGVFVATFLGEAPARRFVDTIAAMKDFVQNGGAIPTRESP